MKHFGDITKLNGTELPIVDIITGGSPCQDLSVAGKRAGLAGERSGLFMDQIRIIKEMRDEDKRRRCGITGADEYIRPRYMVWENVAGAFSSNKGEDFRAVLEETAKVADENAVIPEPPKGKWTHAGCIVGNGWSIAWRVHDAQWWGVPQRRKRICLLADFNGDSAGRILFELWRKTADGDTEQAVLDIGKESRSEIQSVAEGLFGNTETCGEEGKDAATDVRPGIEETGRAVSFQERAGKPGGGKGILIQNEHVGALSTVNNQSVCCFEPGAMSRVGGHAYEDVAGTVRANAGDNQQAVVYGISAYESNAMKSGNPNSGIYEAETARTLDLNGGNPGCNQGGMAVVHCVDQGGGKSQCGVSEDVSPTLATTHGGEPVICLEGNGQRNGHRGNGFVESDKMYTLNTVYGLDRASFNQGANAKYNFSIEEEKIGAQVARGQGAVCSPGTIVRRLTPLECTRLQGFPDGWVDIGDWIDSKGKKHKDADSPKYKVLGNSLALPFWKWLANRICALYDRQPTIASLFDGVSGFPLVFTRAGAKAVWGSEVDEFCKAISKKHFPDNEYTVAISYLESMGL